MLKSEGLVYTLGNSEEKQDREKLQDGICSRCAKRIVSDETSEDQGTKLRPNPCLEWKFI